MISTVFDMSWFLWFAVGVGVIIFAFIILLTGNVNWGQKRMKVLGMLFGMRNRDVLWLTQSILRETLIVSVAVFHLRMDVAFITCFAGFVIIGALAYRGQPMKILFDVINGAAMGAALLATNVMWGFLNEVRSDKSILLIYILLSIFVSVYSLYFIIKDLGDLFERKYQ
jgi:hypothetical protein